ncbi:uncharacterized protein LOC117818693 [Notolabrus celidotus]|uniref:uncharacterized protein LOC117818693 n=1 Tax=Notolabrus celidotus TaxID=1203425 RepID=UPI00149002D0|nr:uncharacterized protein LOC117818693 [Notolabrus celidotus]XP_034547575.1 uncharacterized protein LOC117818693 [Notolabrus celidotus]XP_034547576.1 uncharacterized protein LOC117818693 [Notolabrus celidotus]XP_034547577.1 uncharacterized protein LOC117818693 [Notolabrus celidotus]
MSQYVSELAVSLNQADEDQLTQKHFKKISVDLNQGDGENRVFIWYKNGNKSITRIQLTHMEDMQGGLNTANYTKIEKNLNPDKAGKPINLWSFQGPLLSDIPIVEIDVTADPHNEASKFRDGWERMACDLTRVSTGKRVYLWMKRERPTYICEVQATDSFVNDTSLFQNGFIRMDENTNRGTGGAYVFLWYRHTTGYKEAIKDLQVSIKKEEYDSFEQSSFERVTLDLNKGTGADPAYLWFKKEGSDPVQTLSVIIDPNAVALYEAAKVQVIKKNVGKSFNNLCFYR